MDQYVRRQLDIVIDLNERDILHPTITFGNICDLLTPENFSEVMAALSPKVQRCMAGMVRQMPRDRSEVIEPLPEEIHERLFAWLNRYEASGDSKK